MSTQTTTDTTAVTCARCGTLDIGTYCSTCGAPLPNSDERTLVEFADGFLKIHERWRYLRIYGRILRSPTRNTLALYEENPATTAFAFLQTSVFIYTLLVMSKVFGDGPLVAELVLPVMMLLSTALYLTVFYRLARRRPVSVWDWRIDAEDPRTRSGRDFVVLSAYTSGFTTPLAAICQLLIWTGRPLFVPAYLAGLLVVFIYLLRVWSRFLGLRKRAVLGYMLVASLTTTAVAVIVGFAIAAVIGPFGEPAASPYGY